MAAGNNTNFAVTVEKLNPQSGARKVWRVLSKPAIGGVSAQEITLTPDGSSYFFPYRLTMLDLYTVDGVH